MAPRIHKKFINGKLVSLEIDGVPQSLDGDAATIVHRPAISMKAMRPVPERDWPLWAKAVNLLAKPEDKGIGDIIARTIGNEKSEAFKAWYKKTFGKSCGCAGRQALWNRMYPL